MGRPLIQYKWKRWFLLSASTITMALCAVGAASNPIKQLEDDKSKSKSFTPPPRIGSPLLPENIPHTGVKNCPTASNILEKGPNSEYKIKYNSKDWEKIIPAELNQDASHAFQMKNDNGYAMMIFERGGIPLESLGQIAIDQAYSVAPDLVVEKTEKRTINGKEMLFMQMSGTTSGIPFTYYGYYYSDDDRSIQFLTFTGANRFEVVKPQLEALLNGLIIP